MALFGSNGPPVNAGGTGSGYDRVKVPGSEGEFRLMTRSEFEGLPLPDRVKHLLGGKLVFFRNGVEIAAREALKTGS